MADRALLVIHERRGTWARQLRPRAAAWGMRLVETRSASDLESALLAESNPLLLLDLGDRPASGLGALGAGAAASKTAMALVLDPGNRPGVAPLARELGATLVLSGPVPPPVVIGLLSRWRTIAARRAASEGWIGEPAEALDEFTDLLGTPP